MIKLMIGRIAKWFFMMFFIIILVSCEEVQEHSNVDREDRLPSDVLKRTPATDLHPPILHSDEFETPIPIPGHVNTVGLEDSPFVTADGLKLYFFFTPDARVEPSQQLLDDVSGIWVSEKSENIWQQPTRLWLQKPGKLALDGCPTVFENTMWFCSAREGYTGVQLFNAIIGPMMWMFVEHISEIIPNDFEMGEMHRHEDTIYFHSNRSGGKGGYDIWITTYVDGIWSDPTNLEVINTDTDESLPFVTIDGKELWFTRTYLGTPALFRSLWIDDVWQQPELMVSMFAGEPTLDQFGNLYFVHHYFENDVMIEADIYVAYRKHE